MRVGSGKENKYITAEKARSINFDKEESVELDKTLVYISNVIAEMSEMGISMSHFKLPFKLVHPAANILRGNGFRVFEDGCYIQVFW